MISTKPEGNKITQKDNEKYFNWEALREGKNTDDFFNTVQENCFK